MDAQSQTESAVYGHRATRLLRSVIQESEDYSKSLGHHLMVNQTDLQAMTHLIENGPMSAGDLAKSVGLSPAAATTMIDRLVDVGHVSRESNPQDRRGVVVVPNPQSVAQAWRRIMPLISASEAILNEMSEEERYAVEKYLSSMLTVYQAEAEK